MAPALRAFDDALRRDYGVKKLVGVDEAGRGPWAGPVVAAAVCLGPKLHSQLLGARDSKLLTQKRREELFLVIRREALAVGVSWSTAREIEDTNILAASLAAMRRAALRIKGGLVLVDGRQALPHFPLRQLAIIDGDNRSLAIACASIIAKVVRDRWMGRLDRRYPGYGLGQHKGYGTTFHREALARLGPSPAHRRTFAPIAALQ